MSYKDELISQIISKEWEMFITSKSITGNKVSCQYNPQTFKKMRNSNFVSYSISVLESYLKDLDRAIEEDRNLVAEKYAWMMKNTMPAEFFKIKQLLPSINLEKLNLIDKILQIELSWQEQMLEEYPYLIKRGRPIYSYDDSANETSVETYQRGELSTYSMATLEKHYKRRLKQKNKQLNGAKITMLFMVKQYGFKSLEEANNIIWKKGMS